PKIFFLDKNLNLIKAVKSENKNNHFSELIPNGAIYAIVSDMYTFANKEAKSFNPNDAIAKGFDNTDVKGDERKIQGSDGKEFTGY
ncbi:hypothetical protein VWN47_10150, partial [Campylobacter jejuni]